MNRGHVLQSSPYVQQMMAAGSPNWWNINNMRPSNQPTSSSFLAPHPPPLPPNLLPQFIIPPLPNSPPPSSSPPLPLSSSWNDTQDIPESWSQLLLGGLVGEEDKSCSLSNMQMGKKLENWEEHLLQQNQTSSVDVKQENPSNSYNNMYGTAHHHGNNAELFQTTSGKPSWSQMMPVSSPNSCVTTLGSTNNMLDFSSKSDSLHPPPSHSSECNSTATGGVAKKARVQPSSSTQSTFKVRKEKLGDRITALHQLVSPFGKTDTASVLLEGIGYIRFLQNQIEALSLPYLASGSGNMRQQQHVQGEKNCLFPEDPGQLLDDGCNKKKGIFDKESGEEAKKDLRSRGMCLVPISCTMQVGSDNLADYWAPAAFNGGFR